LISFLNFPGIFMDLRKLKTLIDIVAESQIAELEITEGDSRVRIVKDATSQVQPAFIPPAFMPQYAQNVALPQYAPPPVEVPAQEVAAPVEPQAHMVKSPMVGTFYAAPAPGTPAFVQIGQTVKQGETLCIIEAMKLLNEIESDISGVIKQILVENGHPVEYGQPLFLIE
jgi:acetyl-CoA carboxylase biotin carboxyl carrier protein